MDAATAWEKYSCDIERYIASRLEDRSIVQDVLHDVYLKAMARFDQLRDKQKYKGWVLRIAQNVIVDYYRDRPVAHSLEDGEQACKEVVEVDAWEKISRCVGPFIEQLPGGYREALRLSAIEGCADKEVAARMGLSLSATKSRIARAKKMLKEQFDSCSIFDLGPRHADIESDTFGREDVEGGDESG